MQPETRLRDLKGGTKLEYNWMQPETRLRDLKGGTKLEYNWMQPETRLRDLKGGTKLEYNGKTPNRRHPTGQAAAPGLDPGAGSGQQGPQGKSCSRKRGR
jgi:Cu/Ag efflux protein CusF